MKVAMFSTKPYDQATFEAANAEHGHQLDFLEDRLRGRSAPLAEGADAVCIFVNDVADARVLGKLHDRGVRFVALRCAGYNNVDVAAAQQLGMVVV
ncbi:MAG TPA: 2-hydroxyacid dehydrogenase, partial [Acidimicrobiales bacterium]